MSITSNRRADRIALVTAGFLVVALIVSVAASARADAAGGGGRIAWTRNSLSEPKAGIVSANPNGRHRLKLSHPKERNFDIDADISPDGRAVVLERDAGAKSAKIVVVGADGSGETTLDLGCIDHCALDAAPTWFGASGRIAFTPVIGPFDGPGRSARSAVLQTSLLDGSGLLRFSPPGIDGVYEDYHAHVSPDGSYVVFTRVRNDPFAIAAFRVDIDGTDLQQLTPWRIGGDLAELSPATSGPAKDLVVFETYGSGAPEGKNQNLATVPSTCTSHRDCRKKISYLTDYGAGRVAAFNPVWSPDGSRIAYTLFKDGDDDHECCVGDIWTMRRDGSHRRPVSQSRAFEFRPDWGPAPAG